MDKKDGAFEFHSKCFAATCRNRWLTMKENATSEAAGKELVAADKKLMKDDPDQWRANVCSFLPDADRVQKNAAQAELRKAAKSFQVHEHVTATNKVSGYVGYRRRHFVKFWKKWEDSDSDVANAEFTRLRAEQGSSNDESEEIVMVKNPEKRIDEVDGRQTRSGFTPATSLDPNGVVFVFLMPWFCFCFYIGFYFVFQISFSKFEF